LKDNLAPQPEVLKENAPLYPEARQDEGLGLPERAHVGHGHIQLPEDEMTFQGYRILPRDERPRGGHELYAMEDDEEMPEIALDFGPIHPNLNARAVYNDFKMDEPEGQRVFPPRARQVTPEDFYQPQSTQAVSRSLGQTRGDVTRTRSAAPTAVGQRGGLTDHRTTHTTGGVRVPEQQLQLASRRVDGRQQPSNNALARPSQRQPVPQRDQGRQQPSNDVFGPTSQMQHLPGTATTRTSSTALAPAMQKSRTNGATNVTTRGLSRQPLGPSAQLARALREEELARPVIKWREYREQDRPMDGPSNEVFLTPEEVAKEMARRRELAMQRREARLEGEARRQEDARVMHRHYQG
jgi:hypothetical protein